MLGRRLRVGGEPSFQSRAYAQYVRLKKAESLLGADLKGLTRHEGKNSSHGRQAARPAEHGNLRKSRLE